MQWIMRIAIQLLLATQVFVSSSRMNGRIAALDNVTSAKDIILIHSKSQINKFADSWKYYAKANDIVKREKLKKALLGALHSIESPQKHSSVSTVDIKAINHIKQAATLLKEFKQMYSLSEKVKKTLSVYSEAKKNLSDVTKTGSGMNNLKRFLIFHDISGDAAKRDGIPSYTNHRHKSFIDRVQDTSDRTEQIYKPEKPLYLKRTGKLSVKASPIRNGNIGIDYASVDPRLSNIQQALKAIRAAKIILKYVGVEERNIKPEEYAKEVRKLNNDIEDIETSTTEAERKSIFPKPMRHWEAEESALTHISDQNDIDAQNSTGQSSILESLLAGDDGLSTKDQISIDSLSKDSISSNNTGALNIEVSSDSIENGVKKGEVNGHPSPFQHHHTSLGNDKSMEDKMDKRDEVKPNATVDESVKINVNDASSPSIEMYANRSNDEYGDARKTNDSASSLSSSKVSDDVKPSFEDSAIPSKQDETLKQLKEAKMAREKYEVAKHELAHKIKELYMLANNYEKEETENQILEVKNYISSTPDKSSATPEETWSPAVEKTKRNQEHPGIGLAGIHNRNIPKISTKDMEDDEHKGFTMGAIDKKEHQVEITEKKDQNLVRKSYDVKLPLSPNISRSKQSYSEEDGYKKDGGFDITKDDDTLNIIAQAIQEDMKEIKKGDKEVHDSFTTPAPTKLLGSKKVSHDNVDNDTVTNEKVDEYLTKALTEIIANTTKKLNSSSSPSQQVEKEAKQVGGKLPETNINVVESAMRQHANNPDLPLPLVDTAGDKIKLNKALNKSHFLNDTPSENNDEYKSNDGSVNTSNKNETTSPTSVNYHSPETKKLLDTATHMEENIAAAQDQLYHSSGRTYEPGAGQSNAPGLPVSSGPITSTETASIEHSHDHDPYGSIQDHPSLPDQVPMADDDPDSEDADDEEEEEESHRRHRHHRRHHRRHHDDGEESRHHDDGEEDEEEEEDEPEEHDHEEDDDEEDDDDDGKEDKKSLVKYHDDIGVKRTLHNTTQMVVSNLTNDKEKTNLMSSDEDGLEDNHIEELEDSKRSGIPANSKQGKNETVGREFNARKFAILRYQNKLGKKHTFASQNPIKSSISSPSFNGKNIDEMNSMKDMLPTDNDTHIEELEDT